MNAQLKLLLLATLWLCLASTPPARAQSAAEVVAALHAKMAPRAALETVLDCEMESYVDRNGGIAKEVQNRSRQRITARLLSLDRWVVSTQSQTQAGDYKNQWISDGSGCYARIEEPYRAGQPAVINVSPYELNILTSLLNGDCLLITLASIRSADPASFKLEPEENDASILVLSGRDAKIHGVFKVRLDKDTLQPLSHEFHCEDRLISSLISTEVESANGTKTKIWRKLMFTNDRKLMETQVWTPVSTTALPAAGKDAAAGATVRPEPTLNFPLKPGHTLFVNLPHLKLEGVPSEKYAGKRLRDLISVEEGPK